MAERKNDGTIYFDGPNPTVQSSAEDCDINVIIERAKRGMDVSHLVNPRGGFYGDFTQFPDLREAMLMSIKAQEMFMALDPHIRKRFDNDPAKLVEFCEVAENREEAIRLGLIEAPVEPVEAPISPVPPEPVVKPVPKGKA